MATVLNLVIGARHLTGQAFSSLQSRKVCFFHMLLVTIALHSTALRAIGFATAPWAIAAN